MKIWKLLGAFVLIPALCVFVPIGLAQSTADMFPGIANAWPWEFVASLSKDVVQRRLIVIYAMFALSCLFGTLTAWVSRAIKQKPTGDNLLSIVNVFLGAFLFSCYLLLLVTKA